MPSKFQYSTFVFILFSISCSQNQEKVDGFLDVNIDNIETIEVALSELVENCQIVRLETGLESQFKWASDIAVSDEYILITDQTPITAKIFARDGQFVRSIGSIGKGPAEYSTVVCPYISDNEPKFWMLVGGNYDHFKDGWIYKFDSHGNFSEEVDANTLANLNARDVSEFMVYNGNLLLPGRSDAEYILQWKNMSGNELYSIPNPMAGTLFLSTPISKIYPRGDDIIVKAGIADTIYKVNLEDKTLKAIASIYTTNHKIDESKLIAARKSSLSVRFEKLAKASKGVYSIRLRGETKDYYLLNVRIEGDDYETKSCRVNRKSGKAEFYTLRNDFLGGLPFSDPRYFYQNNYLIFNYSAIELKELIVESIDNKTVSDKWLEKLEQLNSEIDEEDNNVLFVCQLRL